MQRLGPQRNEDPAAWYMALPREVKGGSIAMYGHYVGRPLDNQETPIRAAFADDVLTIDFERGGRVVATTTNDPYPIECDATQPAFSIC